MISLSLSFVSDQCSTTSVSATVLSEGSEDVGDSDRLDEVADLLPFGVSEERFPLQVQIAVEGALGPCIFLGNGTGDCRAWGSLNNRQAV